MDKNRQKITYVRWFTVWLLLAVFEPVFGHFVIPYTLKIREGGKFKYYTVVVVLADHHAKHFGEPDKLNTVLAANFHGDSEKFLREYLKVPYTWYLDQLPKYPRIYGESAADIAAGLKQFEAFADGRSSAVVITEFRELTKVLAFLRVDTANEKGLLASENHFLEFLKSKDGFDKPDPTFRFSDISDFRPEDFLKDFQRLGLPAKTRKHFWLEGENIELKNFGMDPKTFRRFFKYLYLIGRQHKMFDWGAQPFPAKIKTWPDGTPIPKSAPHRWGRRVSHVWLDAYSDVLRRYYEMLGFVVWDMIKNKKTFDRELYFMVGEVRVIEERVKRHLGADLEAEPAYLVRDDELSGIFHKANCVNDLGDLGERKLWLPPGYEKD